ncbi:methyltransferase [Planctomicrobium sp. SH664]|uniref:methyltransferase n=1 Tax=Planctomicrobium sp. SH664 TaxID=3448125 RepID=UPI003F5C8869
MTLRRHFETSGSWLFRWRSYLPFLFVPMIFPAVSTMHHPVIGESWQNCWEVGCFGISLSGLLLRCFVGAHAAPKTSGRNTSAQVADSLNTTGIYSVVRHPLYLGNFMIWLGITLFCFVPWLILIFVLVYWLYYERIMFAEEAFLDRKFGDQFTVWAEETPAFIPRFANWTSPSQPFSLKAVLRREYTGLLGLGIAFAALDQFEHLIWTGQLSRELHWILICLTSLLIYLTLRTLKKKTRLLETPHHRSPLEVTELMQPAQ